MKFSNSIGLDEVGRWPLAGPVSVGGVFCSPNFRKNLPERYNEVTDSKKLSAWQRSHLASLIVSHPDIVWSIYSSSAKVIDRYGIVYAIRKASMNVINDISYKIQPVSEDWYNISLLLDGKTDYRLKKELFLNNGLPRRSSSQWHGNVNIIGLETIVHGDALVWQISAASIIAKVQRDDYMMSLSKNKKYQSYGFDRHKGYGTLLHRTMIAQYGLSDVHRKSFCKNIIITS